MNAGLTKVLLLLTALLCAGVSAAQTEPSLEECPSLNVADLRQGAGGAAQTLQREAQNLRPPFSGLGVPKLSLPAPSELQPGKALESLGSQVERAKELRWREGAGALASGMGKGAKKGWQSVKKTVAPVSAQCLQQWTGRAYNVVQDVSEPDSPKPVQEAAPEQAQPAPLPGLGTATEAVDSLRRTLTDKVMPQPSMQIGSGFIDAVANAFPTAFRVIKYALIWVVSTSIIVTVLLIIILVRLGYILLFSSGRSKSHNNLR